MTHQTTPLRRFAVTVDDPGGLIQDLEQFRRVTRFFNAEDVPVSFFVVPRGEGGWQLDRETEWLAALQQAEREGHDCQLHGLDHKGCEFGPFPSFVSAMGGPDTDKRLQSDREQSGHLWRRDLFAEKLDAAISIFADGLGRRPLVFRTGALSQHPDLYRALVDVGMRYVSNKVLDPRGWKYIIGEYDNPGDWDPSVPPRPYWLTEGIIDLPIASEYAWYLTDEILETHLALALEDLGRVYEAGGVFILCCHVQMVGTEEPYARDLLSRLFAVARQDYDVTFQTMRDLVADIESDALQVIQSETTTDSGSDYYAY